MALPFALLRDPVLLRLWGSGLAINVMRWLELLAFALFAFELSGSPFLVALTTFARLFPLLLSAILTALIEGIDRRRVLVTLMAALVLVDGGMLLLALAGHMSVPFLLLAAVANGLAWTLENPLRRTMLAEAAGLDSIHASMGLEVLSNQLTRMLGAALGGLLIDTIGLPAVFAMGVALHGCALLALVGLPSSLRGPVATGTRQARAGMAEGLRFVGQSRILLGTLAITFIFNLLAFPYVTLAPVIGAVTFHLSPTDIGLLLATEGMGGLCGAMLIVTCARPRWFRPIYSLGAVLFSAGTMSLGLLEVPMPAFFTLFLAGLGIAGFSGMQVVIPLLATPPALRVRVMGILTVCIGAAPLGFLLAGSLAEGLGAQTAQLVLGASSLTALAIVAWLLPQMFQPQASTSPMA